jgi:hypothetical protein
LKFKVDEEVLVHLWSSEEILFFLPQDARYIPGGVNNSNDLERFDFRAVYDPIILIGLHKPEAQRQISQVFSKTAGERSLRQEKARIVDRGFDMIRCIHIVIRNIGPNFEEIFDGLRRELVTAPAWRFSASQARFLSSSLERTWSESINWPRCAAA